MKASPSNFEQYWIEVVEHQKDTSKIVSCLYIIIHLNLTDNTLDVRNKWELEANTIIPDDEWEKSWVSCH